MGAHTISEVMPLAAKKQRRKVIVAGQYIRSIQYSMTNTPDVQRTRAPKTQISSVAREAMNLQHSYQKLKAVIAANFCPTDLVISLTYCPERLPPTRKAAENRLKLFIRRLRAERKAVGKGLPYVYVTEHIHSEGRMHHHVITTSTGDDVAQIRRLWERDGTSVDVSTISAKGYAGWALYLAKEPLESGRRYVGERMWRSSLGLNKPRIYAGWVSARRMIDELPPGSRIMDSNDRRNEYGCFEYIEAILPPGTTEESLALISDLR